MRYSHFSRRQASAMRGVVSQRNASPTLRAFVGVLPMAGFASSRFKPQTRQKIGSPLSFQIRPFRFGDLDEVMAIERASFPDPYQRSWFQWLKLRLGDGFTVAEDGRVLGYAVSEVQKGRGHIISMAVSPGNRRSGVGSALLRDLIQRLEPKAHGIYLEVRISNEAAIRKYEKFSFAKKEVRKSYYPDGEDAWVMVKGRHETTDDASA